MSIPMRRLTFPALTVLAAIAASSTTAGAAPTLATDRGCYTPGETITLTGGGFDPGADVGFLFQPQGAHGSDLLFGRTDATADPAGAFTSRYAAPPLASSDDAQERLFITATPQSPDQQPPPQGQERNYGAAMTLLSTYDVVVSPWDRQHVDPRKMVAVTAFGYEPATRLWAHYVLNGRRVKSVYVGALKGPCGNLVKHMREFPFRPVRPGSYSVYFTGSQTLDKRGGTPYRHVVVPKAKAVA